MMTLETHEEYARRIGAPRVVACHIDIWSPGGYIYRCFTHDYGFNERTAPRDRCPMSRLEEWRQRRWDAA